MLFELERVTIERDSKVVLQDVTASLPKGASCVAGPSGSGKSTLLRLLNRLADPVSGTVRYEGGDVRERDPLELRREVCLVPQLPALLEGTVEHNIRFAADRAGREPDVGRLLDLAGLDASFAARDCEQALGGGAAAGDAGAGAGAGAAGAAARRAHLCSRRGRARTRWRRRSLDLRERVEVSTVLVTHDLDQARRMADWVVRLDEGRRRRPGPGQGAARARMTSTSIEVSLGDVAATLALVRVAVAVSFWRRADLEEDIGIAVVRSSIQLTAIGYVINFIFDQDSLWFVVALIAVMVVFGALQARARAKQVPDALLGRCCWRWRLPPRPPWASLSRSASSSPSLATWCRSGGWWSATR